MRTVVVPVLLGVAVVACALPGAAPAAPQRDALIRMGKGIGKVELGMTLAQVHRALGRHDLLLRRLELGSHGRYLELGWELPGRTSWEPVTWYVGLRTFARGEPLRVTRVSTSSRSERTARRLGVGSPVRAVIRAYPNATCVIRSLSAGMAHRGIWIVVRARAGMTAFALAPRADSDSTPSPLRVGEVLVQREWFSKPEGHEACDPGWEHW